MTQPTRREELAPRSVLPELTPIPGLTLRSAYDLLTPEAAARLAKALRADARTRRVAAAAAATMPL